MSTEEAHPGFVRLLGEERIPKGHLLLVGTGKGLEAVHLLERGYFVVGVDPDPVAIRDTRETVSNKGLFAFFQTGDPAQLPVEDAYFDVVCDFLGAPETEIRRVLKRKGLCVRLNGPEPILWENR